MMRARKITKFQKESGAVDSDATEVDSYEALHSAVMGLHALGRLEEALEVSYN